MATQTHLILGPPGTGKTTTLLNIVDQCLHDGIPPKEIAFASFTRKAAYEARDRALLKFPHLDRRDLKFFSTLHSIAFHRVGLSTDRVLQGGHWKVIGRLCGIPISGRQTINMEDGTPMSGDLEGDQYLFHYGLAHARCQTWEEYLFSLPPENDVRNWLASREHDYQKFVAQMKAYKRDTGMMDFHDMLDEAVLEGPLPVRVAIVDEAQDLSRKQWQLVDAFFQNSERLYIAGDDDQAIYRWSGADLETFLHLQGTRKVLSKSHRLPRKIWAYANQFTKKIVDRYHKEWGPDDREGEVHFITDPVQAPVGDGGQWLILVRNHYLMGEIIELCRNGGIPCARNGNPAVKSQQVHAIRAWEHLRNGKSVKLNDALVVYDHLRGVKDVKVGFKKALSASDEETFTAESLVARYGLLVATSLPWYDALSRIDSVDREYYRRILRRGESLEGAPRVNISTIHGVKGGEADNVLILNTMAWRSYREMDLSPDDEHRVWYVGVTRAREKLFIVQGGEQNSYSFPRLPLDFQPVAT